MKKLFVLAMLMAIAIGICWFIAYYKDYSTNGLVRIEKTSTGYQLVKNESSFFIQGAGAVSNLAELALAGGNTVRTWDTVNIRAILDSAHIYHMSVMVGLPMVESNHLDFYRDAGKVEKQYQAFKKIVDTYKDHPALLMWICGNELDFPYLPRYSKFYNAFNQVIKMIHRVDPNHPVTTTLISFSKRTIGNIMLKAPDLDIISVNSFGGSLANARAEIASMSWFWRGPFILSEWGPHGYWEADMTAWYAPLENTSTKKADQYREGYWKHIPFEDGRLLGTCVFYWGQKQEITHTWYSLFSEDGKKSEGLSVLENLWKNKHTVYPGPKVRYTLINGKGGRDNLLFLPEQTQEAEVFLDNPEQDTLTYKWELLQEDWFYTLQGRQQKPTLPGEYILTGAGNSILFKTPAREGPYRLFVEVQGQSNYIATANIPFYVIAP